ncbi:MAG: hypothetical protein Q7K57_52215 [Burkholderiaceae bacterium]|nr:hypothetical protein [Burkholderiaceae bacterium]
MSTKPLPQHVDLDALSAAFDNKVSDLSQRPIDSAEAFIESTLRWTMDWAQSKNGLLGFPESKPFAIVQAKETPSGPLWQRKRFFREEGYQTLAKNSCLVTANTLMTVAHVHPITSDDLETLGNEIEAAGLASQPALLVDPGNRILVLCQSGIDHQRISMRIDENFVSSATLETLDEMLEKFDEAYTRYPEGYVSIWFDAKERIVYRQAEEMVHNHLFLYLETRFSSNLVIREHQLPVGRADITIYDPAARKFVCVLELKVFRDKGLPREWPNKASKTSKQPPVYTEKKMHLYAWLAVGQTARYKSSMQCALAFLCCYDAREGDSIFQKVEDRAKIEGIEYRRYRMHTKSGAADATVAV